MMMTSAAGLVTVPRRAGPVAASSSARACRTATASRSSAAACPGVVANRPMHDSHGLEFHAVLEVDGPDHHVRAGGQVAHEHVEPSALCRTRWRLLPGCADAGTGHGRWWASSNGPRSIGCVIDVTDGPGHGIASACGSALRTRSSNRSPGHRRSDRPRTAPRKVPSPDSIAGILAVTSAMVWPRARRNRARHPQRSTAADMTCDPASPTALAMSGHASSLRSTCTLARRRRFVHHGTDKAQVRR